MTSTRDTQAAFTLAVERYASLGVDVHQAIERLRRVSISLHCWQGDDVSGFEGTDAELGSGLAVTGNYLGRARTPGELRSDLDVAYSLIPGRHRLNLHAIYGEFDGHVERDEISFEHFRGWMDWARERGISIDFNPTFFAHPKASDGFTLSSADPSIRKFWIDHGIACRNIAAAIGEAQGNACVHNVWIPDGYKDLPASRSAPRERLTDSLDEIFARPIHISKIRDAVESKLFGIGSESYVVGSHEFYLGYAIARQKLLCLDAGHFHPTESIADKISSVLMYVPEVLLHVSRGVRWDSDHVVLLNDDLQAITSEIVRGGYLDRVHIGLDFFDASINRVAAWVIGTRNTLKSMLISLLEPTETIQQFERSSDFTARLAWMEEQKSMPWAAVWDHYCAMSGVPVGGAWLTSVREYESSVLAKRNDHSVIAGAG